MGEAGAGKIGNYSFASFSVKGVGRFKPESGVHPTIGKVGEIEEVAEEQIQTVCKQADLERIINAIKKVHPYEEIVFDVIALLVNPEEISKNNYWKK